MLLRRFQKGVTALVMSALVLAVSWPSATPASAAGPVTCQFSGVTSQLTPVPKTGPSSGTYTFSGTANCITATGPKLNIPVTSSGTFDNIQCGTGTARGSVSITGVGSFSYSITFASGVGVLTATSAGDTVAGELLLVPPPGGCVFDPYVLLFTISGDFAGVVA
jgi:hypothetical protein